jgi:hypothetical protein
VWDVDVRFIGANGLLEQRSPVRDTTTIASSRKAGGCSVAAETRADEIAGILTGAAVRSVGRAADMGVLEFDGPDGSSGEEVMAHLQCPFRIVQDGTIVLGSADMRYAQKGAGEQAFDEFRTVFDARAAKLTALLGQARPRVVGVSVGTAGELAVTWEPAFRLEAFPDCSGQMEAWRVLLRGGAHHGFPAGTV